MMKLWLLEPTEGASKKNLLSYDCLYGAVVRAKNESDARYATAKRAGDEGFDFWLNTSLSSCKELTEDGLEEVILINFVNG